MNTTRRRFFSFLATGAAFVLTPLGVFGKSRTEIVHATAIIHRRITETGGSYLYITTQVRGGFKVGEVVKVTIESKGQAT